MGVCCAVVDCYNSERDNQSANPASLKHAFFRFPKNATLEEKHKELKKELKRKRNCERQRTFYQRQKDLKKNEEKTKRKKVPKTNAERQREFRQRQAEKSYVDMRREWLIAAGRMDLEDKDIEVLHKNYRICNIHFDSSQRSTRRLKPNAVPILHLPGTSGSVLRPTKSTQTEKKYYQLNPHLISGSESNDRSGTIDNISIFGSKKRKLSSASLCWDNLECIGDDTGVCCAVLGCINSEDTQSDNPASMKCGFFRFPQNETLCRQWIMAAGRTDLLSKDIEVLYKNYRVCSIHFGSSLRFTKILKSNAVPCLHLPNTSGNVLNPTDSIQTGIKDDLMNSHPSTSGLESNVEVTPDHLSQRYSIKRELSNSSLCLDELEYNIKTEEDIPQESEEDIPQESEEDIPPEPESEFVIAQKRIEFILNKLKRLHPGESSDNNECENFITSLYFASPLAYRFLYKTLKLPDEKTLRETNIDITTKLSDSMVRCLDYKCKRLSESEKICVISVSAMCLKSEICFNPYRRVKCNANIGFHEIDGKQTQDVAKHAVVMFARGLFAKWTQPVAFCLQKSVIKYAEVAFWVNKIVTQMKGIGFDVVALTTDSEPLFFCFQKNQNIMQRQEPEPHYVFDVPNILNSIRNELMKNNFSFQDGAITGLRASWDDIQNLFGLEQSKSTRIAHKLTGSHIRPQPFEKATVKFAAQVFSMSVAAAIEYNIGPSKLPGEAIGTAIIARKLNDVFDILNSSPKNSRQPSGKYKKRFSGERYQTQYLQDFLKMLSHLRVITKANKDVTPTVRWFSDLKKTIYSILHISAYLKNKGFHYFYTRRLNADVLQDFFNTLRQNEGHCREPTPKEFYGEFKKHFLNAALDTHRINLASEINILFSTIDDVLKKLNIKNNSSLGLKSNRIELEDGHTKLLKIKSEEDVISNQSEESESENENEIQIECSEIQLNHSSGDLEFINNQCAGEKNNCTEIKTNQIKEEGGNSTKFGTNEREEVNSFPENKSCNNKDMQMIPHSSNKNKESEEENELQALNEEIDNIVKEKLHTQSINDVDYSVIKIEED